MGNYKFRLSDMMPNVWFYKLKGMSRARKHHSFNSPKKKQSSEASASRKLHDSYQRSPQYHFTTKPTRINRFHNSPVRSKALDTRFPDTLPRKSSIKKKTKRKTVYKPSPKLKLSSSASSGFKHGRSVSSSRTNNKKPGFLNPEPSDCSSSDVRTSSESLLYESFAVEGLAPPSNSSGDHETASWSRSCDFVIDMKKDHHIRMFEEVNNGFELEKAAEITQVTNKVKDFKKRDSLSVEIADEEPIEIQRQQESVPICRKSNANSAGIRLRVNSPKIARKRKEASATRKSSESRNKGISDCFAIVMSSVDPLKDFRESMAEMIAENNIRESKGLEDLLACYLSLNSSEYHEVIIKAFEKTWSDFTNLGL